MRISDWSSDVCSSDLAKGEIFLEIIKTADDVEQPAEPFALGRDELQLVALAVRSIGADPRDDRARGEQNIAVELAASPFARAEERRVGKEGVRKFSSRWAPFTLKKKNKHIQLT